MKNHAAYPEIGFLTKSTSQPYSRATAMPPALELRFFLSRSDLKYSKISDFLESVICRNFTR